MVVNTNNHRWLSGFLFALLIIISTVSPAHSEEEYRFERSWPTLQQPWYFASPHSAAIDRSGYVYVADNLNNQVHKFTNGGQFVTKWGSYGIQNGQFYVPASVAVDENGYVYVADLGNNRIQKFTKDGQFVTKWGSYGSGDGQFSNPWALALDRKGYVYVADTTNHRIQKFTNDGQFVSKWGSHGSQDGLFYQPRGITVDDSGFVYIADTSNDRIQKFTDDGQFVAKWGSYAELNSPSGIVVDGNGYAYVADTSNHRIKKFNSEGQLVAMWGSRGGSEGQFNYPWGVFVDNNGYIYVADMGNNCIQKFTSAGQFVAKWGSSNDGAGQFHDPWGITIDTNGYIYVADYNNHRIQKFTDDGRFSASWGGYGNSDGQFNRPYSLTTDGNGFLYVADAYNHRIQKFTAAGQFVTKWGSQGSDDGQFEQPLAIAADANGFIYVADFNNERIQKFTNTGQFVTKWGGQARGVAVDNNGYVFIMKDGNCIEKYTSNGEFVESWSCMAKLSTCITFDSIGNAYVVESAAHQIHVFSSDGYKKVGAFGSEPGLFNFPLCIAVGRTGLLYVTDSYNHRVQVFRKVNVSNSNKAVIVAGGGNYGSNELWNATSSSANFAYRALTYQGFTKESIYYLTSDMDLDLDTNGVLDDVDGDATKTNLQQAITNWAAGADSLVIYLVDHGGNDTFRLNAMETLSAAELATWLNQVQATIPGKVIVVYDACESGSFVADLAPPPGKERVVIASTAPEETAKFLTQGSISFSNFFWTHIFNGLTVKEAFDLAGEAIGMSVQFQNPQMDDNGNGLANEIEDGLLAAGTYIGNGTRIQGEAPVIASVSPAGTITGTNTSLLYAEGVMDGDGIARVWAVIRPPNYRQGPADNPVQSLPSIDLMPVGNDRYEAAYNAFSIPGTYQIAVYARDRVGNTSIPKVTSVTVISPLKRRAVIVAGGSQSDALWPAVESSAKLAYEALSFQGYTDEEVYLLAPASIPGVTKMSLLATLSNLRYALTCWGKTDTLDVVLYLIGDGLEGLFKISASETLKASDLKIWLDDLQQAIPGKVVVVYDAFGSGSFLPILAPPQGKERILLASAGRDQVASFLAGGDISFSKFFWRKVLNGASVRDSFLHAKRSIQFMTTDTQIPQIDDNGNGIGNEKIDGAMAMNYTLGAGIMLAGDAPLIGSVSSEQTLTGESSAILWAKDVTSTGTIRRVWAVITPPGYMNGAGIVEVDLLFNGISGRYEGTYNGFSTSGPYDIAVYAKDLEGNVSLPSTTKVTQTLGPDIYETDDNPAYASVINDGIIQTHNFHRAGDGDWIKFYALGGTTYEFLATNLGAACDVVIELYDTDGATLLRSPVDDGGTGEEETLTWTAPANGIYYLKIRSYDPAIFGAHTEYDIKFFRPIAVTPGIIQGIIYSDQVMARISGAAIQAGLSSALSLPDGSFTMRVEPGTFALTVALPDSTSITQQVAVQPDQVTTVQIGMLLKGDLDGNGRINLADAILALQVLARMNPTSLRPGYAASNVDVNQDRQIGLPEAIHVLKRISGM